MQQFIPIVSLVIAALAVVVGPAISLAIAKRQIRASGELANKQIRFSLEAGNKQITAPMRQAWINDLRSLLAEIISSALHYYVAGFEERTDKEYRNLAFLQAKIQLMLNAKEDDHRRLEALISSMIDAIQYDKTKPDAFPEVYEAVICLSKAVLKREWEVIKEFIPLRPFESDVSTS